MNFVVVAVIKMRSFKLSIMITPTVHAIFYSLFLSSQYQKGQTVVVSQSERVKTWLLHMHEQNLCIKYNASSDCGLCFKGVI